MRRASALTAAVGLGVVAAFAFLGPLLYRVDPTVTDLAQTLAPSSPGHPLGTDESGRDVLARLMVGGRVTLLVGVATSLVALVAGTLVGGLAVANRRWVDALAGRLLDAAMAIPSFFVLLVIVTLFGGSIGTLIAAIGATAWVGIARLVRAEALSLREREFVAVARALGAPASAVFRRHVLPHLRPTLAAAAGIGLSQAVLTESALSFLGLGIQPPEPSWGNMLTGAQPALLAAPWLALYPGACIVVAVLSCNAIIEQFRVAQPDRRRPEAGGVERARVA